MSRIRAILLGLALTLGTSAVASAQGAAAPDGRPPAQPRAANLDSATLDARTREVAAELRCPVCQGESIQESPSELAQEMKGVVRDMLAAGKTPDEVKDYFVGRYGEWILLRPTTTGFNAMLYWLPPVLMVAGVVVVLLIARRWIRAGAAPDTPPVNPDNAR